MSDHTAREADLVKTIRSCVSALRAYQLGEASHDLARNIADMADQVVRDHDSIPAGTPVFVNEEGHFDYGTVIEACVGGEYRLRNWMGREHLVKAESLRCHPTLRDAQREYQAINRIGGGRW